MADTETTDAAPAAAAAATTDAPAAAAATSADASDDKMVNLLHISLHPLKILTGASKFTLFYWFR